MKPVISILIPAYNADSLVEDCIENTIALPQEDIEIIVGDDGSTDDTPKVINKYSDRRLKTYTNETNLGYDENIFKISKMAEGKYIYFVSDEDIIHPTGFNLVYDLVQWPIELSVIFGNILDGRKNKNHYYYNRNETIWLDSEHAIRAFTRLCGDPGWWGRSYLTGTIINRGAIDFEFVKDYIGCGWMASALVASALLEGSMYWMDAPLAAIREGRSNREVKTKIDNGEVSSYSPDARFEHIRYRLQFARDSGMSDELLNFVTQREMEYTLRVLHKAHGYNIINHISELDNTIITPKDYIKLLPKQFLHRSLGKASHAVSRLF